MKEFFETVKNFVTDPKNFTYDIIIGAVILLIIILFIIVPCVVSSRKKKQAKAAALKAKTDARIAEPVTEESAEVTKAPNEPAEVKAEEVAEASAEQVAEVSPEQAEVKAEDVAEVTAEEVKEEKPKAVRKPRAKATEEVKTEPKKPTVRKASLPPKSPKATENKGGAEDATKTKTVADGELETKAEETATKSNDDHSAIYHVTKRKSDGKWQVKYAGGQKAIKLFDTQAEAIELAKKLSANREGSVAVHKTTGQIRKS